MVMDLIVYFINDLLNFSVFFRVNPIRKHQIVSCLYLFKSLN